VIYGVLVVLLIGGLAATKLVYQHRYLNDKPDPQAVATDQRYTEVLEKDKQKWAKIAAGEDSAGKIAPQTVAPVAVSRRPLADIVDEDPVVHAFIRRFPEEEYDFKHLDTDRALRLNNLISLLLSTNAIDLDTCNYLRRFIRENGAP
jgi:hypothetical protein